MAWEYNPPKDLPLNKRPSLFLAGPIQDGPDWQREVVTSLSDLDIDILNPRAPEPWHGDWDGQVDWETICLRRATMILFWLALPEVKPREGRSYAQTSRFELGEWVARAQDTKKLIVGVEPGFSNERYIRKRLGKDYGIRVYSTLDECISASRYRLEKFSRLVQMERDSR